MSASARILQIFEGMHILLKGSDPCDLAEKPDECSLMSGKNNS
jgi:hypothetical protein